MAGNMFSSHKVLTFIKAQKEEEGRKKKSGDREEKRSPGELDLGRTATLSSPPPRDTHGMFKHHTHTHRTGTQRHT